MSLVPPQSYFDIQSSEYTNNIYLPPVDPWHQEFRYTSRNVYAYWLAKFGNTRVNKVINIKCENNELENYEEWEVVKIICEHVSISCDGNISNSTGILHNQNIFKNIH